MFFKCKLHRIKRQFSNKTLQYSNTSVCLVYSSSHILFIQQSLWYLMFSCHIVSLLSLKHFSIHFSCSHCLKTLLYVEKTFSSCSSISKYQFCLFYLLTNYLFSVNSEIIICICYCNFWRMDRNPRLTFGISFKSENWCMYQI